jgi:hypothetical protein
MQVLVRVRVEPLLSAAIENENRQSGQSSQNNSQCTVRSRRSDLALVFEPVLDFSSSLYASLLAAAPPVDATGLLQGGYEK